MVDDETDMSMSNSIVNSRNGPQSKSKHERKTLITPTLTEISEMLKNQMSSLNVTKDSAQSKYVVVS